MISPEPWKPMLNRDAIRDAVINAKRNDIRNIRFYNDDAGKFMVEMAQKGEKADVVIMDPPRTGSDEAFLSSVVKLARREWCMCHVVRKHWRGI